MALSHAITFISWLIFIIAGLSFCDLHGVLPPLPKLIQTLLNQWQLYLHEPLSGFVGPKIFGLIDLMIAGGMVVYSLFRQKSRLNRIHKDLAIALSQQPEAAASLGMSFNASDTKAVYKLIERVKTDNIQADPPHLPRSNWLFTSQSMAMVAVLFFTSIWVFVNQLL
ncbi:hypothetical protein [Hirschia baltica]|uniref:Transmembrane protein n=1 Tax=Hirschia baltica (strain ATCC 49814 / DSM 5838 / IFAM 1418) TaxID=582402 RepID=C6XKV6_HIRBI|nr:hypothetical protein [Hirschia baltica]ACT57785.1 hypothetical protein Hbal_0083 [Hirschia baltica ATCC 49814]